MNFLINAHGESLNNRYRVLADDEPALESEDVAVSLSRWQLESAALSLRRGRTGLSLDNTVDVLALSKEVLALPLIVINFPSFGDGRAYSQARLLRERCGYTGAIRATGAAVVGDQLIMLKRCGVSEFLLRSDQNLQQMQAKLRGQMHEMYQPDVSLISESVLFKRRTAADF